MAIRFGLYLLAALRTVAGEAVDAAQRLLLAPQPRPPKAVIAALAESLGKLPAPFALVLDDYHVITAHPVHEAMAYLLERRYGTARLRMGSPNLPALDRPWA